MKTRLFPLLVLATTLALGSCNSADKRTDGTAGEAVSDMDKAAEDGGVEQADATVIDNDAGPTVTAKADSAAAADTAASR